jgi:hypothetical protein
MRDGVAGKSAGASSTFPGPWVGNSAASPRRLRECAQQCLVGVTHTGTRIGNGNEGQGDIIHAEGVRGDFLSSAPQARGAEHDVPVLGRARGLPCLGEAFNLVAQMLEIARTDT